MVGAAAGRGGPAAAPGLPACSTSTPSCAPAPPQLKEAVHFHFNFSTPFRPGHEEAGPGEPRPAGNNNKKRAVTNLAAVMGQLQRGPRLAAAKA